MTRMLHLCGLAAIALALVSQARAEGNRLLPFWGQPYPTGFARTDVEPVTRPPTRSGWKGCRVGDPSPRRHGRSERCGVVLHARD